MCLFRFHPDIICTISGDKRPKMMQDPCLPFKDCLDGYGSIFPEFLVNFLLEKNSDSVVMEELQLSELLMVPGKDQVHQTKCLKQWLCYKNILSSFHIWHSDTHTWGNISVYSYSKPIYVTLSIWETNQNWGLFVPICEKVLIITLKYLWVCIYFRMIKLSINLLKRGSANWSGSIYEVL